MMCNGCVPFNGRSEPISLHNQVLSVCVSILQHTQEAWVCFMAMFRMIGCNYSSTCATEE